MQGGLIMDFNTLVSAISTVGFPIVFCVALFWQNNELNKNHKEEINSLKEVIENNTLILREISTKLHIESEG